MLGPVLDGVADLDVTVLYSNVVRPFDGRGLREAVRTPDVVLVEPYLSGTSARCVNEALVDVPHRLLSLGVARRDLRRYGEPAEHAAAHGLDSAGIREAVLSFVAAAA
jgi:transketolase